MKSLIKGLFKKYYELTSVIEETTVRKQGNNIDVITSLKRASEVWDFTDERDRPDEEACDKFIEAKKEIIAEDILLMTRDILINEGVLKEAEENDTRRTLNTHQKKLSWSRINLLKLGILDPFDRMIISTVENKGVGIGFKHKTEDHEESKQEKGRKILEGVGIDDKDNY